MRKGMDGSSGKALAREGIHGAEDTVGMAQGWALSGLLRGRQPRRTEAHGSPSYSQELEV